MIMCPSCNSTSPDKCLPTWVLKAGSCSLCYCANVYHNAHANSLNAWASRNYQNCVEHGFHDDDQNKSMQENLGTWMMNLHSEISEVWEAYRAGKLFEPCDKSEKLKMLGLPVLTCIEEEFADIFLRLVDDAKAMNVDLERAVNIKHTYNVTRPHMHGKLC